MAKRNQFSREEILQILDEYESGAIGSIVELCQKYGISRQAYYSWRAKFGAPINEHPRLLKLEAEIEHLRLTVVEQMNCVAELQARLGIPPASNLVSGSTPLGYELRR